MTIPPDILANAEKIYDQFSPYYNYDRRLHIKAIAVALTAERERCAKIAESFTGAQHAAHDMATGVFPKQSYMGEAIAAAIRKG